MCVCVCVCELLLLVQCIQHQLIHLSLSLSLSPLPSLLLPHNTRHTSIYILSCADYCKHLMKTTKEKEDAVEKARNELEMKKRKLEEEKANESRSDPESVTSSLTGSTGRSDDDDNGRKNAGIPDRKRKRRTDNEAKNVLPNNSGVNASCTDAAANDDDDGDDGDGVVMNVDNNDNDNNHANEDDRKKKAKNDDLRKDGTSVEPGAAAEATAQGSAASTATMEASVSENPAAAPLPASTNAVRADTASGTDTAASSNKMDDNKRDNPNKTGLAVDDNNNNTGPAVGAAVVVHTSKKAKMPPNSSSDSSSGDDHVQNITLHDNKTASSVSDITDSNKGSSGSSGSISSTAAVARGTASRDRPETHADIVVKISSRQRQQQQQQGGGKNKAVENNNNANKKNSANKELTSLDSNFDLDFEDVFVSSNVPQLIATPAGRIVACKSNSVGILFCRLLPNICHPPSPQKSFHNFLSCPYPITLALFVILIILRVVFYFTISSAIH